MSFYVAMHPKDAASGRFCRCFFILMCLLFYGDFDIAVFVFYLQGILCLIFRTDKLSVIFIGWIGSTALAAHQAAVTFSTIGFLLYSGIGAAVTILISNARGSNRDHEIRPIATAGIHIVLGLILVVTGIMFFARQHIGYIFTDSPDVAMLVSAIVIPMIVYQLGDGLQITLAGALRGLGVVKPMVRIAFTSYFIVSLPASYCFAFLCRGGAPGVWWGYPVGLSCAALLFFWQFHQNSKPEKIRH